jgi:hypothetical protein
MGAFDQFKDKADKVADNAKEQLGNRRGQSARGAENPERMERGDMQREGRERASEFEDEASERTDRRSEREQDDWA